MPKLDKAQLAELQDLYSPNSGWGGVREMAKYFGVGNNVIRWAVDYRGYKEYATQKSYEWIKKNPEKAREMLKKAVKKYKQSEKGKAKIKAYNKERSEILRRYYRRYYKKKKIRQLKKQESRCA